MSEVLRAEILQEVKDQFYALWNASKQAANYDESSWESLRLSLERLFKRDPESLICLLIKAFELHESLTPHAKRRMKRGGLADHYVARTGYARRSMATLKLFFPGCATSLFRETRNWHKHSVVIQAGGQSPGWRLIWIPKPRVKALRNSEELIAWAWKKRSFFVPYGYRPIRETELIALHVAHPELYRDGPLAALGSFVLEGGVHPAIATLSADDDGQPRLGTTAFHAPWNREQFNRFRFPFVRLSKPIGT